MGSQSLISDSAGIGEGFFGDLLLGYALKKAIKLIAVIVRLFVGGLAYLQYQQILSVNRDKIESTIIGLADTTINTYTFNDYNVETLTMTNLGIGIPLTVGMQQATIGVMKR
jgi:uncharacterized membrane protein (Fun14 family)